MKVAHIDAFKYTNWQPVLQQNSITNILPNLNRTKTRIQRELGSGEGRSIALVGYGPSLPAALQHLNEYDDIVTCSGAHNVLVEHGICPTYHVEIDPRPHKAKFTSNPQGDTTYLFASHMPTDQVDTLINDGYDVALFNQWIPEDEFVYPSNEMVMKPLGFVGNTLAPLMYSFGYRKMGIFGMDCSYHGEQSHSGEHGGYRDEPIRVAFAELDQEKHPIEPLRVYQSEYLWIVSALEWRLWISQHPDIDWGIFCAGVLPEVLLHKCILPHGDHKIDPKMYTEKDWGSKESPPQRIVRKRNGKELQTGISEVSGHGNSEEAPSGEKQGPETTDESRESPQA